MLLSFLFLLTEMLLATAKYSTSRDDGNRPSSASKYHHPILSISNSSIIINLGMPKSGTTSLDFALKKLHVKTSHQVYWCDDKWTPLNKTTVGGNFTEKIVWPSVWKNIYVSTCQERCCFLGIEMQRAISQHLPPLQTLINKGYRAFTQLDVCYPNDPNVFYKLSSGLCIFPQVDALEDIVRAYPNALYIYTHRIKFSSHILSIRDYNGMLDRFKSAGYLSRWASQSVSFTGKSY